MVNMKALEIVTFLLAGLMCFSNASDYCYWYYPEMAINKIMAYGHYRCARYRCTSQGKLTVTKECPKSNVTCPPITTRKTKTPYNYDEKFPACCRQTKCEPRCDWYHPYITGEDLLQLKQQLKCALYKCLNNGTLKLVENCPRIEEFDCPFGKIEQSHMAAFPDCCPKVVCPILDVISNIIWPANRCSWYHKHVTLNELIKHNYHTCALYSCSMDGSLEIAENCPKSKDINCRPSRPYKLIVKDPNRPYPSCCERNMCFKDSMID